MPSRLLGSSSGPKDGHRPQISLGCNFSVPLPSQRVGWATSGVQTQGQETPDALELGCRTGVYFWGLGNCTVTFWAGGGRGTYWQEEPRAFWKDTETTASASRGSHWGTRVGEWPASEAQNGEGACGTSDWPPGVLDVPLGTRELQAKPVSHHDAHKWFKSLTEQIRRNLGCMIHSKNQEFLNKSVTGA